MMKLTYLYANMSYVFTFGDATINLASEPLFYETRNDAVAAARRHGLSVNYRTNEVTVIPEEEN